MKFTFSLEGYHGLSGTWTIVVPASLAGDLPNRVYGLELKADAQGHPIGQIKAKHLGTGVCSYDVESVANLLRPRELRELEKQARTLIEQESAVFAKLLAVPRSAAA